MSRSEITLQEWLNTDVKQKLKFIMNEMDPKNIHGVLTYDHNQPAGRINLLFRNHSKELELYGVLQVNEEQNNFCFNLGLTLMEYNKLRAKYRRFNNKKNESNISKKQYRLSKETITYIKKIKKELNLSREECVIENSVNFYLNKQEVINTKVKLNTKTIKFNILNQEINKLNIDIQNLNNRNEYLSKKIKELEKILAESYLESDQYKYLLDKNKIETSLPKIDDEKIKNKVMKIKGILKEHL